MVCSRPACVLLACVGFGQETRANAPSPTSNGCQAPLNVTGWLESRGAGGGVEEGEARARFTKKRHPATAELISQCWIQPRSGRYKANQMQREQLCATVCLVRAGSARGGGTGGRPLYGSDPPQMSSGFCTSSLLTASFQSRSFWGSHAGLARTCSAVFRPSLSTPASGGVYRIFSHFLRC